jgi:hypothetical protein
VKCSSHVLCKRRLRGTEDQGIARPCHRWPGRTCNALRGHRHPFHRPRRRSMRTEFEAAHKAQFGFVSPKHRNHHRGGDGGIGSAAEDATGEPEHALDDGRDPRTGKPDRSMPAANGTTRRFPTAPGSARHDRLTGPALIIEANQTIVIEPGWQAAISPRPHGADPRREKLAPREFAIGTRPTRSCWRCSTTCSCRSPSRWA